jgi:hypothetical protein
LRRIRKESAAALAPAYLDDVVEFLQRISNPALLAPAYDGDALERMLRSLMARAAIVVHQAMVLDSAGQPVGWFVWLLSDDDGRARVVELVASPTQELPVLTALLRDARKRGATRMSGEAHPRLLKAVGALNGRFVRSPKPISVWTRDTSALTAILRGDYIWSGLPAVALW